MKIKICPNCQHEIKYCYDCPNDHCDLIRTCECQCWEYVAEAKAQKIADGLEDANISA